MGFTEFSDNYSSKPLKQIARVIEACNVLGQSRQAFFLQYEGWDHHFNVVGYQESKFPVVSKGLDELQCAMRELGEFENEVTFTVSDFSQMLT